MILKAYKYRIYPTANQRVLIEKHIGSCRFVYNLALETKQVAHQSYQKNLSCFDLIKQIPDLKKNCEFLKEINSQSLQASIKNLDTAFTNFFKNKAGFPKQVKTLKTLPCVITKTCVWNAHSKIKANCLQ